MGAGIFYAMKKWKYKVKYEQDGKLYYSRFKAISLNTLLDTLESEGCQILSVTILRQGRM